MSVFPTRRVRVLFAHPALEKSRVNRLLLDAARSVEGVVVDDLYERYPDFHVDVAAEQRALAACDALVLQHPFFWYSAPALVKEWIDLVLEHGWAYGREGTALKGKRWLQAITTGGAAEAYRPDGFNRHTLRQLLAPFEQTARLCGMATSPPFAVRGTHRIGPAAARAAADDYARLLTALRDGAVDWERAESLDTLNDDLDGILGEGSA